MKLLRIIKDWALIVAMVAGVVGYVVYAHLPFLDGTRSFAAQAMSVIQPALIFLMLFFTFCKVKLSDLRLRPWHLWLLLIQGGAFVAIGLLLIAMPHSAWRVALEGAMILLICPTATAAPVITKKLGGDVPGITTYTILINLLAAVLIPALLPYVHPQPGMTTINASLLILGKVFPLLVAPLLAALLLKFLLPKVHRRLADMPEVSFYLWLVALASAMAMTARSLAHTRAGAAALAGLLIVSLACCAVQFWCGWRVGTLYGERITAGQSMGQKNTVLAIWLGYTFFTPVTSVAGGFYSIWHNVTNSWQLYKAKNKSTTIQEQYSKRLRHA